ncbi:hypothetical protein QQS21_012183 [Conoideocrella luteorostrata]|uniref:Cutinase n=1 Tax=Conoideocrella luteorostrata TaxID=1105319 RepID=A0AAJ0FV36_9HYPO|nr:hypothetical protein QQS21_012183 [Conoideocrella luteorostrata]
MKLSYLVACFTTTGLALPARPEKSELMLAARDFPVYRNDLQEKTSPCPKVIFIYARATNEPLNMGVSAGPIVASKLEDHYGESNIWVQGVGLPYLAVPPPNIYPNGASQEAINEAARLFLLAQSKCPNSPVVAGGYSQGTGVIVGAVRQLSQSVQQQIKGVVLFGYTRNKENGGRIPDFPPKRTKVFCAPGDALCDGTVVVVSPAHFTYFDEAADEAPAFLIQSVGE